MKRECGTCEFKVMDITSGKPQYFCFRYPPVALLMPTPSGQAVIGSAYPPTTPNKWCGEYRLKLAVVKE